MTRHFSHPNCDTKIILRVMKQLDEMVLEMMPVRHECIFQSRFVKSLQTLF
jgi:hypothetical protein